jgi:hypothetical protein
MDLDYARWREALKDPRWYRALAPEIKKIQALQKNNWEEFSKTNENLYDFFETQLKNDAVPFGHVVKNWDKERLPIDTVVVHHTSNAHRDVSPERLSAIELVRLYAPHFAEPSIKDKEISDLPVYSGHTRKGKQVFYAYHWLVRDDGSLERLLFDHEIGWHAGDWEVNRRSVAICFTGNYENSRPSDLAIKSAARIIKHNYPYVATKQIIGHCEVNPRTACPSKLFLSVGDAPGWKEDLLSLL